MAETEANSTQKPPREALAHDIERNISELRDVMASLTGLLRDYGGQTADDARHRAGELSDKALEQAVARLSALRKRLAQVEGPIETHVKEHPLGWLFAALGVGLILSLLASRRH